MRLTLVIGSKNAFAEVVNEQIKELERQKKMGQREAVEVWTHPGYAIIGDERYRHATSLIHMKGLRAQHVIFVHGADQLSEIDEMRAYAMSITKQ